MKLARLAIFAAACLFTAPTSAEGGFPVYQAIEEFGTFGPQNAASGLTMTAEEVAAFEQALGSMGRFPAYFYSGCHDRAHAAYLMLPENLRSKVRKIWVVGPARFTAAIPGTIRLRPTDAQRQAVDWGYHVALAIDTASGMRVFDAALHPEGLLSREQWFGLMVMPPLSIWTVTRGDLYLFNYATLDSVARNGSQVWNGNANYYHLLQPADQIMPDNLARDAIGADAMQGRACQAIRELITKPQDLLDFLRRGAASAPADCAPSFRNFAAERTRWTERLHR